jgi:SAM-dependent methyltransferase
MNARFVTRHACPACATSRIQRVFARPYADPHLREALTAFYAEVGELDYAALLGAEYALARCHHCGLIFQTEVPDATLLARLYEEWISPARAFARHHGDPPPHRRAALECEARMAASMVAADAPRVALDYGCGWGEWACQIGTLGFAPWGTELSATRRIRAEQSGIRIIADADLPDHLFGLINLDQVLEHVPSPRATLSLLAARLHPGGVLRVGVPNGLLVSRALRRFDRELERPRLGRLNPVAPLEHLNCFTFHSLLRLAEACGLRRVRPPWNVLWRNIVVPPGNAARLKALLRPLYLRSRFSTLLFFHRCAGEEPPP